MTGDLHQDLNTAEFRTLEQKIMKLLITGGAGFIGSNFILHMMNSHPDVDIINLDVLTYAGNLNNLKSVAKNPRYTFIKGDICDKNIVNAILDRHMVDTIIHFAAESHVDRSISEASEFVRTNVLGTHNLLECARHHPIAKFIHISTDEVYGSTLKGSFHEKDILPILRRINFLSSSHGARIISAPTSILRS
jgi:dTDP-glucose 4,6-dehydratase